MKTPYTRFFWSDWNADTGHLDLMQLGAYIKLLSYIYQHGKPLPGEHDKIYRLCHATSPTEQQAIRTILDEYFKPFEDPEHGPQYRHFRAEREIEWSSSAKLEREIGAAKTNWLRWGSEDAKLFLESHGVKVPDRSLSDSTATSTATSTASRNQNQNQNQNQKEDKPTPRKIPEDWWPNERNLAWLKSEGVHGDDVRRLVVNFRDYWLQVEKRYQDWDLVFRRNPVVKGEIVKLARKEKQADRGIF